MEDDDELGTAATVQSGTHASYPLTTTIPSVIVDRYEILGLLGAGGMGRVYRACDRMLDELVALKLLRGELLAVEGALERFRQEVKLARRVTHVNVVRTFDLGQHANDHFLTMELIDGQSLARLIDTSPLAVPDVVRIAREIALGIAAAHASAIVHRDLKPDNVLVAKTGRIAITDFGVACASEAAAPGGDRFVGTPAYMAPEQVEPGQPIGPAADVYAFGVMLFEMLAGRRPFVANDPVQLAALRLHVSPPDARAFRTVPDPLAELALRCMALDVRWRPANGGALVTELAQLDSTSTTTAPHGPVAVVPYTTSRAVAILPLRASEELAALADGLSEEIVDVLSMTRDLRVRPLAAVRRAVATAGDPHELGRLLGVDVVVDGSLRRRGDLIRIAARALGVADGFQLWASHFDTTPDRLLEASDEVGRAVARVLMVDLEAPDRALADPHATALCVAAKAKLRARWLSHTQDEIIVELERALELAPGDPAVQATLATALARAAFFGAPEPALSRALELADHAVARAPRSGDAWFALGVASLYSGAFAQAGHALYQAVQRAPGFAMAQALLGGLLLEAGGLAEAIAHLEAANRLDPNGFAHVDLPRAYVYAGRWADAERELASAGADPTFANHMFDSISRARFALWRGELVPVAFELPDGTRPEVAGFGEIVRRIHATGQLTPDDRARMDALVRVSNPRLRVARAQFMTEYLLFTGDPDDALSYVQLAVDAGLVDITWLERCPLLAALRTRPEFVTRAAQVAERAHAVLVAIGVA